MKLYFMIGLPTETQEDVAGIVETAVRARSAGRRGRSKGRTAKVNVAVSTFVPKPHTPFQWVTMDGLETVFEKQRYLRDLARNQRVDHKAHEPHGSILEGILARGDRRLADVIEQVWKRGARYDAWDGHVRWELWMEAMADAGLTVEASLAGLPVGSRLPWSHIDVGLEPSFLEREWDRAQRGKVTLPCGRPAPRKTEPEVPQPDQEPDRKLVCHSCGVGCDLEELAVRRKTASDRLHQSLVRRPEPAPASPPSQTMRVRFRFEKLGRSTLLGHLDLVREVPRILRRAGLPVWYSQGFHPKPVMTFGPALGLGIPSFEEFVDIKTATPIDCEGVLDAINAACPSGLRFLSAMAADPREEAIVNTITGAALFIALAKDEVDASGGQEALQARIQAVLDAEKLEVVRKGKEASRTVEVRPFIATMAMAEPEALATLERAGIGGDWYAVRVETRTGQSGTVRPDELATLLSGPQPIRARAVRLAMVFGDRGKPVRSG